jgi:Chaperone of endosialidase
MTTLLLINSISRSPSRVAFLLTLACICFGLSPAPKAFGVSPPPDGGYANGNTAEGQNALFSLTTGIDNTAVGFDALFHNTTGGNNTAGGFEALFNNTTGADNTATGLLTLALNTSGHDNTATGSQALFSNTTGNFNTAAGSRALLHNTTGTDNTATGFQALTSNTTGKENTANGFKALFSNTTGNDNTATGFLALRSNTTGNNNTANGIDALIDNTTGNFNTANGLEALFRNTTGSHNTANGVETLENNTTGNNNIALGVQAGFNLTTGSNNIDIGNQGVPGESSTIRIGIEGTQTATFIAGISGSTVANGVVVVVDTNGHLGVGALSSQRFKDEIKPMDKASEAILALKPVTFRYKQNIDPKGIPQFGLVAEEVEKVNPALVTRDAKGEIYTVRYEAVNAMLLNEFLKEHRTVQELKAIAAKQEATIAKQQQGFESKIAHQQEQIEALTAGLQRVSAQVEMSRPTSQIVLKNQ